MKKNFLTAVAVMVSALFVGTIAAEAAGVTFGGQLRPRFEYDDKNFDDDSDGNSFVSSRIRLNATADILPDLSAFIQLQSVRTWGQNFQDISGFPTNNVGSGNASFSPDDRDQSVGVHQAYFTLKNAFTLPVDLQVGRQEVVLDGHRILGNTDWTQGAQTHDAVRVTHAHDNLTIAYVYSFANEGGNEGFGAEALAENDNGDIDVHVLYANLQGVLGGALSAYYVAVVDNCGLGGTVSLAPGFTPNPTASFCSPATEDATFHTIGLRQAGQLYGIDYRAEGYYQTGDSFLGGDVDAYMFGARIGKKFNNVMWKPSLTVWYDYLSGTEASDLANGDIQTFNTLFDTGHKFYGYMDYFLVTPVQGLQDFAIKASVEPMADTTLKADFHFFSTSVDEDDPIVGGDGGLGQELDLTLVHKYNANLTMSLGYSYYWADEDGTTGFAGVGPTADNSDWAYLMLDVKF